MNHVTQKPEASKTQKLTHSTAAPSANPSRQATSASLHLKDTATAAQSAGLTAKLQQASIPKVQSSQFQEAKWSTKRKVNSQASTKPPRNAPWEKLTKFGSTQH